MHRDGVGPCRARTTGAAHRSGTGVGGGPQRRRQPALCRELRGCARRLRRGDRRLLGSIALTSDLQAGNTLAAPTADVLDLSPDGTTARRTRRATTSCSSTPRRSPSGRGCSATRRSVQDGGVLPRWHSSRLGRRRRRDHRLGRRHRRPGRAAGGPHRIGASRGVRWSRRHALLDGRGPEAPRMGSRAATVGSFLGSPRLRIPNSAVDASPPDDGHRTRRRDRRLLLSARRPFWGHAALLRRGRRPARGSHRDRSRELGAGPGAHPSSRSSPPPTSKASCTYGTRAAGRDRRTAGHLGRYLRPLLHAGRQRDRGARSARARSSGSTPTPSSRSPSPYRSDDGTPGGATATARMATSSPSVPMGVRPWRCCAPVRPHGSISPRAGSFTSRLRARAGARRHLTRRSPARRGRQHRGSRAAASSSRGNGFDRRSPPTRDGR